MFGAVVVVAARVALALGQPWILSTVASMFDAQAAYDSLSISFTKGTLLARGVSFQTESDALDVALDSAYAELDMGALVRGQLKIDRVEVDGLTVELSLNDLAPAAKTTPTPSPEPEPRAEGPLSFELPFVLSELRASDLTLRLRGLADDPERQLEIQARLQASGIGVQDVPLELEAELWSQDALERASVRGRGAHTAGEVSFELQTSVRRLQLSRVDALLSSLGLATDGESLDADLHVQARLPYGDVGDGGGEATGAELHVSDVSVVVDRHETAGLQELALIVASLDAAHTRVEQVTLDGLHVDLGRSATGAPSVAGFEWFPVKKNEDRSAAANVHEDEAASAPTATVESDPWRVSVDELRIADAKVSFADDAVAPAFHQELALEQLVVAGFDTQGKGAEPAPCRVALMATLPSVLDTLRIDGTVVPLGTPFGADLAVQLGGFDATRLAPYFEAAGVSCLLRDAQARFALQAQMELQQGRLSGDVSLSDVALVHDDESLASLGALRLRGVDVGEKRLAASAIEIDAPVLRATRDAAGTWAAFGVSFGSGASSASVERTPQGKDQEERRARPVRPRLPFVLQVDRLALERARVALRDEALGEPLDLMLQSELTLETLVLGPGVPATVATLEGAFDAGALGQLSLTGTLQPELGERAALEASLALEMTGLDSTTIEPYWMGKAEDELHLGPLDVTLTSELSLAHDGRGWGATATLGPLTVRDEAGEQASLREVSVPDVSWGGGRLRVPRVELEGLTVRGRRPSEDVIELAGLRLTRRADAEAPTPATTPNENVAEVERGAESDETPRDPEPRDPEPRDEPADTEPVRLATWLELPLGLGRIAARDVQLTWDDAALEPPVSTSLSLDASLDASQPDAETRALALELGLRLDGGNVALQARVEGRGETGFAHVELAGSALDTRAAANYVTVLPLLETELARSDEGLRARTELTDLELSSADAVLFAVDSFRASLVQPDVERRSFEVEEVALEGLELDVRRGSEGLVVAGIRPRSEPRASGPREAPSAVREALVPQSFRVEENSTPTVRVDAFELELERLTFVDEIGPDPTPLVATGRISVDPGLLLGPVDADVAPVVLTLNASAEPVLGSLELRLQAEPFRLTPQLDVEVAARDLRGTALRDVLPEAFATLDPSRLEHVDLEARAHVVVEAERDGPLDFDLPRVGGNALISEVALRDAEGQVLAGLASLELDAKEISTRSGRVHLRSVRLLDPKASMRFVEEGMEISGLLVRTPASEEAREPEPAPSPELATEVEASAPRAAEIARPRFQVDVVEVSGIDVALIDARREPEVVLPVDDLDLELTGLQLPPTSQPVRMGGFVSFGSVELSQRKEQRSLVTNMVGGVVNTARTVVPGQKRSGPGMDSRPLGSVDMHADLVLVPTLTGQIETELAGIELEFLRERAQAVGVDLRSGLLDATVALDFHEEGLSASTRSTWTALDVSEAENGPVRRLLKLPVPLNAMVFLLRDRHGQVRLDFDFDLPPEGMSVAAATAKATEAIGQVVTRAVANSPMRVAGAASDVLRLGTDTVDGVFGATGLGGISPFKKREVEEPQVLTVSTTYEPGAILISTTETAALVEFVERWAKSESLLTVQHYLGGGDVARAAVVANPRPDEARALIERFERKRGELLDARTETSRAAVEHFAGGRDDKGQAAAERLSAIDRELGQTERALDELYELARPGSEHLTDLRTRATALALAARRLELIEAAILRRFPEARSRLRILRPRYAPSSGSEGGALVLETRL